jgi:hypothetical protein
MTFADLIKEIFLFFKKCFIGTCPECGLPLDKYHYHNEEFLSSVYPDLNDVNDVVKK